MLFGKKNMKRYNVLLSRKIRNILLSDKTREFLIFLFFVLISFSFWMLQMLDDAYQTNFSMQVRLKNVPKEVVMTAELPSEITVRVEDRGTVLLNYMLGRSFYPLAFDFEDYDGGRSSVSIPLEEVKKKISAQLNTTTKLLAVRPDSLGFIYAKGSAKKVPVALDGQVTAGREFYVSEVKLEPDSVMVYAPENLLNTIHTVYTEPVSIKGVTDTITKQVKLQKIKGAKFVPATEKISVMVDMYSEKKVEVPIVGLNFPAGKALRTFPSKAQVYFQVGVKNFSSVTSDEFFIGISYDELLRNKGDQVILKLKKSPEYVGHLRIVPPAVDYLIEERFVKSDEE